MRVTNRLTATLIATLALVAGCSKDNTKESTSSGPKPSYFKEETMTATATVEAVDQKTREIKIKNEDGEIFTFTAGPEVENFAQIQPGDRIEAKYYEALAIDVSPAGAATPAAGVEQGTVRTAPLGDKPAGIEKRRVTMTATVEKIDRKNQTVTLRGPMGNQRTIKVRNPKHFENLKIGDNVTTTYTEAMAVAVKEVK